MPRVTMNGIMRNTAMTEPLTKPIKPPTAKAAATTASVDWP